MNAVAFHRVSHSEEEFFPICWSTLKTNELENSSRSKLHISERGKRYFEFQIENYIRFLFNFLPAYTTTTQLSAMLRNIARQK